MSEYVLPPPKPYHPTTFLERGVAVPFTTPLLGGTRARPGAKQALELVIPNPSGGRGVYIMPWKGITSLCRPTLHDKIFNERIGGLEHVTPSTIRQIAKALAAEGLAGEEAMEAARISADAERGDRVLTNYRLLMTLVEQVSAAYQLPAAGPGEADDPSARARVTVEWISPRIGQSTTWTATALEELADVMSSIGVGTTGAIGRVPRLVALLRQVCGDITEWSRSQVKDDQASYVHMICIVAEVTLSLAENALAHARSMTGNMLELLKTWAADSGYVVRLVSRPEWLLDGWEQISLIWTHAEDDAARRAALVEIAGLIPVLPREVTEWSEASAELDMALRFRRLVALNEDWRTGAVVFDLIARNEHFRAISCRGSYGEKAAA